MHKADFKRFYEKHVDRVYRFVLFRVRMNEEVAQDLTSEIFMKALRHFAKYDSSRSQYAWIMTIARNHVFNHWRDTKEQIDIDEIAFTLEGSDGEVEMEKLDDYNKLRKALEMVTPHQRKLIEMKYLLGYRYKETGAEMGKKADTVRVETHRAMKKLKAVFRTLYGQDEK